MLTDKLAFQTLTKELCQQNMAALIAVSEDVSDWQEAHFLADLPNKWQLSFIAFYQDQPVAYAILSNKWPERVHIHQFMVSKTHRGQGVGEKMLQQAIVRAQMLPLTLKVAHDNQGAIRFYLHNGFTLLEREAMQDWLIRVPAQLLGKKNSVIPAKSGVQYVS